MALKVRRDVFGVDTGIRTEQLFPSCRMLSMIIGQPIPANKAIVEVTPLLMSPASIRTAC